MRRMVRLAAMVSALVLGAQAQAIELDPKIVGFKLPDQIQWTENARAGNRSAILQGDPTKPGACLELIKWHPNHFSHPHYHSHARYAVVIDGTWWVSTSNVYDPDHNTVPYPKGSVLTDLVKGVHYDGAKPETGDGTVAIFMDCPLDATPAEVKP